MIEKFLEGIKLPEEGRQVIRTMEYSGYEYHKWKELFYKDEQEFIKSLGEIEEKEKFLLWFYTKLAVELYNDYQKDGIKEQIYYDTFYDFTIWYQRCKETKNIPGLDIEVAWWLALPLKRKLYRLGRLQFEIGVMRSVHKGEKVLHVHIPEGEKLDIEKCEESFQKAKEFFGDEYQYFDCLSWLLSPNLQLILNEDSNIIRFQKLFQIQETVYTDRQAEKRVYGYLAEDAGHYPEHTSLQKGLKQYVKENGNPGIGYGIRKRGLGGEHVRK